MIYYIYRINFLCGESGRYYIGKHCAKNWDEVDKYTGSGVFCKKYFNKYGKDGTYTKDILNFAVSKDDLAEMEYQYIESCLSEPLCKNLTHGGVGGWVKGKPHSDEHNRKVGLAKKGNQYNVGKHLSEETKQKISSSEKGKILSEDTRLKISIAGKGRIQSEETKAKRIASLKGKNKGKHRVYHPDGTYTMTKN